MKEPREFEFICDTTEKSEVLKQRTFGHIWTDKINQEEKSIKLVETKALDELQVKYDELGEEYHLLTETTKDLLKKAHATLKKLNAHADAMADSFGYILKHGFLAPTREKANSDLANYRKDFPKEVSDE